MALSSGFFSFRLRARPDETNGANGKKSALLAEEDLEVGEGGQALLGGGGLVAFNEEGAVFLQSAWGEDGPVGRQVLRQPCACPVQDEGGIGMLCEAALLQNCRKDVAEAIHT